MASESEVESELRSRWMQLVESVGASSSGIDELLRRHAESHRRYHTADHVFAVLRHLDALDASADPAVVLAAFYHDAIYETEGADGLESNEERSAQLAEAELAGCDAGLVARVAALIRATEGHKLIDDPGAPAFSDADLAILGSDPKRYMTYCMQIRQEYAHLGDVEFRVGRRAVLQMFLERESLYYSTPGRELWEQNARKNMAAEIELMSGRP